VAIAFFLLLFFLRIPVPCNHVSTPTVPARQQLSVSSSNAPTECSFPLIFRRSRTALLWASAGFFFPFLPFMLFSVCIFLPPIRKPYLSPFSQRFSLFGSSAPPPAPPPPPKDHNQLTFGIHLWRTCFPFPPTSTWLGREPLKSE